MTAFLSAFTTDPLRPRLDRNRLFLPRSTGTPLDVSKKSPASLENIRSGRQFSPASEKSVASAPIIQNVTGYARIGYHPLDNLSKLDVNSFQTIIGPHRKINYDPGVITSIPPGNQAGVNSTAPCSIQPYKLVQRPQRKKGHFENDTPTRAKQKAQNSEIAGALKEDLCDGMNVMMRNTSEPFPELDSSTDSACSHDSFSPHHQQDTLLASPPNNKGMNKIAQQGVQDHRQRPSDASSNFVGTMRTASISNVSSNTELRSPRLRRSSTNEDFDHGNSRQSLDSQQALRQKKLAEQVLNRTPDERFKRALKRQQIIKELVETEEGYVTDLKALANLYPNLSAPILGAPDHLSSAVQRNITEILHNHEALLEKLRRVMVKNAAKKWANANSAMGMGQTYRVRRRNGMLPNVGTLEKNNVPVRNSIDDTEYGYIPHILNTAEPSLVLEIVEVFEEMMSTFHAYEEYCANHQSVAAELQKLVPETWSTYNTGVESLNQTVRSLNNRSNQGKRGATVKDLLIKPVQRICRYPLMFSDLLKYTPFCDSNDVHMAVKDVFHKLQNIGLLINQAINNHVSRSELERKWLVRHLLMLHENTMSDAQYRALGTVKLCGVLHLTYQTPDSKIDGFYAVCILFDNHLLITTPMLRPFKLDLFAAIQLTDMIFESASLSKGLQAVSSLHTFKIGFNVGDDYHEILLSACSSTEESTWLAGLRGKYRPKHFNIAPWIWEFSWIYQDVKTSPRWHISKTSPTQRSVREHGPVFETRCRVMISNTYNPQGLHEFRGLTVPSAAKLPNPAPSQRIMVLSPKRVERTELETALNDVYTKDKLPFPGMIGSTGGRIIRASAGSLVRKLSFASMQATFSRRSTSVSSKKSCQTVHPIPGVGYTPVEPQPFNRFPVSTRNNGLYDMSNLDTMDNVVERMIGVGTAGEGSSSAVGERLTRKLTKSPRVNRNSICVGPDDPASVFYDAAKNDEIPGGEIEEEAVGGKKKRWSNPISRMRSLGK